MFLSSQAFGHGALDEQIKAVSARIKMDSVNTKLYVKRGQLYVKHEEFQAAIKDYQKARRLQFDLHITDLLLAQLYVQTKELQTALIYANTFLEHNPTHISALITRAGIYQELGQGVAFQSDLESALHLLKEPNPGHYTDIADAVLLADGSNFEEAIIWLKKGQQKFGFDIVLKSKEIELHQQAKQYDQAILVIDSILEKMQRKEKWLFQKALMYQKTENRTLAKAYYEATLNAIQQLPKRLQGTTSMLELEIQAIENIALLNRDYD